MINKKSILFVTITTFLALFTNITFTSSNVAFADTVTSIGANNGNVWDIQFRLKTVGFYNDNLDGIYGNATAEAVRRFQSAYGITVDGVVGSQTLSKLKKVSVDQNELDMLAHMIYAEARGENYEGQVAVGAVIMNRLQSSAFPNSIHDIIFQSRAFSSVDDGQYWLQPDETAYKAALDAVRGWDPSKGALYYFNPKTATSSWIWSRPQLTTIGNHIFCK